MNPERENPINILNAQAQYLEEMAGSLCAVLKIQNNNLTFSVGRKDSETKVQILELNINDGESPYPVYARSIYSNTQKFELTTCAQLMSFLRTSFNCRECIKLLSDLIHLDS